MGFNISKKYNDADPRKLPDWQVADIAEETMPTVKSGKTNLALRRTKLSQWEGCVNSTS